MQFKSTMYLYCLLVMTLGYFEATTIENKRFVAGRLIY